MQEAICEIILKTEKTRKFVCDYRLKSAVKAMDSMEDDLSIHTPNEVIHLDMKNIKICTMASVPALNLQKVCLSIAYKSGTITNIFVTEDISNAVTREWSARDKKTNYIRVFDDESMLLLKVDGVEYMSAHSIRFKESNEGLPSDKVIKKMDMAPKLSNKSPRTKVGEYDKIPAQFYRDGKLYYNMADIEAAKAAKEKAVVTIPKGPVKATVHASDIAKTRLDTKPHVLEKPQETPAPSPKKIERVGNPYKSRPDAYVRNTVDHMPQGSKRDSAVSSAMKKIEANTIYGSGDKAILPAGMSAALADTLTCKDTKKCYRDEKTLVNGIVEVDSVKDDTERGKVNCSCGNRDFISVPVGCKYSKCPKCGKTITRDPSVEKAEDSHHRKADIFTNYYVPFSM